MPPEALKSKIPMIYTQFQYPQLTQWQTRLARVPRWGWIAFFVGVIAPLLVFGFMLLLVSAITGILVMGAAILVGTLVGVARRMLNRGGRTLTQRGGGQIIIASARVIDP
jgi:hypothetical protein